jgi:PKD repeat protein
MGLIRPAVVVAWACVVCSACTPSASTLVQTAPTPTVLWNFPAPSQLPLRQAATLQTLPGSEYDSLDLPPQRVAPSGTDDAQFSPQWSGPTSGFANLAFALYLFPSEEGNAFTLTTEWVSGPDEGECWIGLANFELERWDWGELPASGGFDVLAAGSYAGYTANSGDVVIPVLVVTTGTARCVLNTISIDCYSWSPAWLDLLHDPEPPGSGEETDRYQIDYRLTLLWNLYDPDSMSNVTLDPQTQWLVDPPAAGQFWALDLFEAFHLADGYTGDFRIGALYLDKPCTPVWVYFHASDTSPWPNQAPLVSLDAEPKFGAAPLLVNFDARGSYDPDGIEIMYHWDFDGDGSSDLTGSDPLVSHEYSADGNYHAQLEIEDADEAAASTSLTITVSSGPAQWHLSQLRAAQAGVRSEVGTLLALTDVGGQPAIAFTEQAEGASGPAVHYLRALDGLGTAWDGPQTLSACDPASSDGYLQLKMIDGQPAVAASHPVRYLRAGDAVGGSWGAGATPVESDANVPGVNLQLLDVGGLPALCYADTYNGQLIWIKGDDAAGSSFSGRTVLDTKQGHAGMSNIGEYCSLVRVGGNPAIAYMARHIQASEGNEVRYIRATDAAGSAWASPVTVFQGESAGYSIALLELGSGLPGVSYQDYGASAVLLNFKRGADSAGSSWSGAVTAMRDTDSWRWWYGTSPILYNGQPALGAILENSEADTQCSVQFARALDADGSSWEAQQNVAPDIGASYRLSLDVVDGVPVLCYHDAAADALYFGAYY